MGLADGLDMRRENKRAIKNNSSFFFFTSAIAMFSKTQVAERLS